MYSDVYELFCLKVGMMTGTNELYSSIHVYVTFTSIQRCKKVKTSALIIWRSFQSICMALGVLLRFVGVTNFTFIQSHPRHSQGRGPYLCDFSKKKKKKNLLAFRHLQTDSFQLGNCYVDKDHKALHFGISLDDLDFHSMSQLYEK